MSTPERLPDERLADWVDGRMNDREQERFRAELRVNAQLRADLAEYEATVAAVRAALQAPTRPAAMADRVLAAIASKPATPARPASPPASRRWFWGLLPAAAALALAFGIDAWTPTAPAAAATPVAANSPAPFVPPAGTGEDAAAALRRFAPTDEGAAPTATPPVAEAPPAAQRSEAQAPGTASATKPGATPIAPVASTGPTPVLEVELQADGAAPRRLGGLGDAQEARGEADAAKAKAAPLDAAALRAALLGFLATAGDPAAEPAAMTWTTTNGELAASPWLDAASADDEATTRAWIVEGPKADVAELLAVAAGFARDRKGVVRSGETKVPAGDRAGASATVATTTQLVLRVKLRRR